MIKVRIIKDPGSLSQELDRLLSHMVFGERSRIAAGGRTWTPQIDVYETQETFQVVAELPGVKPEDVDVVVDRTHIKLTGRRGPCLESANCRVHQAEIVSGPFGRVFRLPSPVVPDQADASFENGLLTVRLPKERARSGRIEVQ